MFFSSCLRLLPTCPITPYERELALIVMTLPAMITGNLYAQWYYHKMTAKDVSRQDNLRGRERHVNHSHEKPFFIRCSVECDLLNDKTQTMLMIFLQKLQPHPTSF